MNITKRRKTWFGISAIAVMVSLASILIFGLKLGLDFTGGARWDISFDDKSITQEKVATFLNSQEIITQDVQVQASDNKFMVTIQDLDDKSIQNIAQNMKKDLGEFKEVSFRKVDANIGGSFKTKALYAIITALIGIILFVAFAFRKIPQAINPWRFGGVAIIALFHDIILVFGIFVVLGYMFQVELDLAFVTALLATLGFSVNDTIVILDRVRENIRLQKMHETFEDTIEKSVQQTLARSINTSFSTLLPLLGLLFFGAESIYFFVLALVLGIIIGTYSSIFLAAPMLVEWKNWADARDK